MHQVTHQIARTQREPVAFHEAGPESRIAAGLLAELQLRGDSASGRALRRLMVTVATKAQYREGQPGTALLECSMGYLAEGAGVGVNAARDASRAYRSATRIVGLPVSPSRALDLGWPLREVMPGRVRGPLILMARTEVDACAMVTRKLGLTGESTGRAFSGWLALGSDDLMAMGYRHVGPGRKVLCPLHPDTDPSLVLFGEGKSGAGFCHGGCGPTHWTLGLDTQRWVKRAGGDRIGSSLVSHSVPVRVPSAVHSLPPVVRGSAPESFGSLAAVQRRFGPSGGLVVASLASGLRGRLAGSDLPLLLARSDRAGPVAERDAAEAAYRVATVPDLPAEVAMPGRLLSVGLMLPSAVSLVPLRGRPGLALVRPERFEPGTQRWVLVDLDDLAAEFAWGSGAALLAVAEVAKADPLLTGRVCGVATSETGLQFWLELRAGVVDPRSWWRAERTQAWYRDLGSAVLGAVRRHGRSGGHVDASAAAAGRYGRRPGWRVIVGHGVVPYPYRVRFLGLADSGSVHSARDLVSAG